GHGKVGSAVINKHQTDGITDHTGTYYSRKPGGGGKRKNNSSDEDDRIGNFVHTYWRQLLEINDDRTPNQQFISQQQFCKNDYFQEIRSQETIMHDIGVEGGEADKLF